MSGLFQAGRFRLHSGAMADWKVECEALTADDWDGLAVMALPWLRDYSDYVPIFDDRAEGLAPHPAVRFARALSRIHPLISDSGAPVLVVDDVWTTGASMKARLDEQGAGATGLVAFARNPIHDARVRALWTFGLS